MFQAGAVKVKHDLLLVVLQVNQSKTSPLKSTRKKDGSVVWHPSWHPRILCGAMHSGKKWRSALWLNAMHSGKKWWIRESELPSIYSFKILFIMLLARSAPQQLHGLWRNFSCRTRQVIQSRQDSSILPARVAHHSAGFDSSCPLMELAIYM